MEDVISVRGHALPVTCVAVTADAEFVFTASKDCTIIQWKLDGTRVHKFPGGHKSKDTGTKVH